MKSWHKSRRRHSFLPTSPPGPLSPDHETPASPDSVLPIIHSPAETRDSVVSLDGGPRAFQSQSLGMLAVPDAATSHSNRKRLSSLLTFRTKSDSHLSKTAKSQAEEHDDSSEPPAIMRTAPTQEEMGVTKRKSTFLLPRRPKTPKRAAKQQDASSATSTPRATFEGSDRASTSGLLLGHPPAYGDTAQSQLAVPLPRISDSSRSDGSSGDHTIYGQTTTVTQTTHTTTTFFKLPRRKKEKGSLFPLPPRSQTSTPGMGNTPNLSTSGFIERNSFQLTPEIGTPTGSPRRSTHHSPSRSVPNVTPAVSRSDSKLSAHSTHSIRGVQKRGRSSTAGSARRLRREQQDAPTPPLPASSRTSTSTAGRPSLAGLFNMSKLRQPSEMSMRNGSSAPATPLSMESGLLPPIPKSPAVVVPERQEGDTPAKYLARLEELFSRSALVPILSKTDEEFMKTVLRSYMRRFKFFEEPIDMAVRKLLMQIELPKETQQIDRTLQSFADRYHECNPGIFQTPDEAYFIAFSILILHTDVFNKNNKRKMQKTDYLKNTQSQGVAPEILECFYDNVAYTPFIHLDDDTDFIAENLITHRRRTGAIKSASTTSLRRQGQPVDPYALIMDSKLDGLRVAIDDVIAMDDPFTYMGTAKILNHSELRKAFFRMGVIQIVSSRSRPDAFMNQATIQNPFEAQVGVVDMRVTKVGILWRKDPKKRKTRSPWQEWGAVLTGSQLYLFRNKDWVKSLMHQHEYHIKAGRGKTAVVFKPPIENFRADFLISTEKMVALCDSQYKRHKNAFVISRENIYQEVLLADSEAELNDWLAKLNYVAAFRTSGVRMRGVNSHDNASPLAPAQGDAQASQKVPHDANMATDREASAKYAHQIALARREILAQKLEEMAERMVAIDKILDAELRTARHLAVLTPIQDKTRHDVLTAAARLSAKLRWERMNRWRVRCHRDILHIDLDEDLKSVGDEAEDNDGPTTSVHGRESRNRLPFPRFNSRSGSTPSKHSKEHKFPVGSPNATAKFLSNVEDMFKTPSRGSSKHQRQGSWELPPLTFERRGSGGTAVTGASTADTTSRASEVEHVPPEQHVDPNVESESESSESEHTVEEVLVPPAITISSSEEKKEKPSSLNVPSADSVKSEDDAVSTTGSELSTTPRNKRHSLTKHLHSVHNVSHARNRKTRESSSTVNTVDDGSSLALPDAKLTRSQGSFTLHGKKASVITFGSEWQALSGEDGLKARKSTITGEGDLPPPDLAAKIANEVSSEQDPCDQEKETQPPAEEKPEFVDALEIPDSLNTGAPVN